MYNPQFIPLKCGEKMGNGLYARIRFSDPQTNFLAIFSALALPLTLEGPETPKYVLRHTVKTQMKCHIMNCQSLEKEIQYFLGIITCSPSIYTMDHSDLTCIIKRK